jgi:DNA-binding IclR family transcriptional regulator
MSAKPGKSVPVMSVKKALDLLGMIVFEDIHGEGIRLSDLAGRLGLPLNTARNLLKTMIGCGFVAQRDDSRYVVGPVCRRIGIASRLASASSIVQVDAALRHLVDKLNEAVVFTVLSDGIRVTLREIDSNHQVRTMGEPRRDRSFYDYVTARVLTAYASAGDKARILARHGMPGVDWDGIATPGRLDRALARVRADGFCRIKVAASDLIAIAVPVLDANGELLGALGLYAPAFRSPAARIETLVGELQAVAGSLGRTL